MIRIGASEILLLLSLISGLIMKAIFWWIQEITILPGVESLQSVPCFVPLSEHASNALTVHTHKTHAG